MLTSSQSRDILDYRHRMRLSGRWGACYEVSCFVEHRFGWRRRDGVYQLPDGTPVFLHAWNETADGTIIDATADQFRHGQDLSILPPGTGAHYRERYTVAHNPAVTPWLAGRPWPGIADTTFWQQRYDSRRLGPGWWLDDALPYRAWLAAGAAVYPLFAAKRDEYAALGYDVD